MNLIILAIISSFILALIPYLKKIIFQDMEIIPFMILVSSIVLPILLSYYFYTKGFDKTISIYKDTNKKDLFLLLLITTILLLVGNYYKNYMYKTNNINQAEPITIALTIIITILYGCLFFDEKLTSNIIVGIFSILIGIYFINK